MADYNPSTETDEVQAQLDCLEYETGLMPFMDEAVTRVNYRKWRTKDACEFLKSMRDWEFAEVCSISNWFSPPLILKPSRFLNDIEVAEALDSAVEKLYEKKIVLEFTDHLSDRELYDIIACDILPLKEKRLKEPTGYIHWNLALNDTHQGTMNWLMYYASDKERSAWADFYNELPPNKSLPLYPRDLPTEPEEINE